MANGVSSGAASRFEHYVPKVYLKKFVAAEQGRDSIHRFDKIAGTSSLKNLSRAAGARNFYESDGLNLGGVEAYLGEIESRFGPARDKLLGSEDLDVLTDEERRALAYFAATQFVRTQETRSGIRDLMAEIKASLRGERLSEALSREIEEAQSESSIQDLHLSMLENVPEFAGNILAKKWIVILNRTVIPFWTSDHPINLRNEIAPPGRASYGLGVPGIQVFLPLSPWFTLLFCDFKYYMLEPDKLIATDIHNVVFQNDWQLRQCTRYIFSDRDDFSLARRIIEGVPEVADPNRRRISSAWLSGSAFSLGRRPITRRPQDGLLT